MRYTNRFLAAGALALAACAAAAGRPAGDATGAGDAPQESPVQIDIINAEGQSIGTATFTRDSAGVRIRTDVSGLAPGPHGVHIHSTGSCEPPAFESAGPHLQPENRSHGFLDPQGPHAGDLPMMDVNEQGEAGDYDFTTAYVSLDAESLLDEDGTALILHAEADDYLTDTGGGTGDRIACGVISPAGSEAQPG